MENALQNSVWVVSPEFSGYLFKRGFHWRKLWKKRWVALHGAEIAYMPEQPNPNSKDDLTITKAQITSSTIIDREDIDGNPHGFAIHINDGTTPTWYLRAESTREKKSWLMRLGHVHTIVRWLEEFEKVRILGVGGAGIVYELLHKTNGQRYAMKEMEIKNKGQMQMAVQEAEMLKEIMENISHPNIMHIEKVFQVGNKFYLVFPLCTGGELYEHIIKKGHFSERDAAIIMRDLMSGLHELHRNHILHLDIKPENILFDSDTPDARIKITDFGLSKESNLSLEEQRNRIPSSQELESKLKALQENGILNRDCLRGTVGYMSPELILAGVSSEAADVWAAGVVLYILLCGRPPFHSKSNREILERSARGDYSLDGKDWDQISEEAKELVRRMLTVDPKMRITCPEILAHPWLQFEKEIIEDQSVACGSEVFKAKRHSITNLGSALSALSGHVNDRKIEKMASSFTNLVVSLQKGQSENRHMLSKFLQEDGGEAEPIEEATILMSQTARQGLMDAFKRFGDGNGNLTIETFKHILMHFGYGGEGGSNGVAITYLCRLMDKDGDGLVSPEDIFATQAMLMQRSEHLLRTFFRVYVESCWYPGRQLNVMNLARAPVKGSGNIIVDTKADAALVEPPKYITVKHVVTVFEKLGYLPTIAQRIFHTLCDLVKKKRGKFRKRLVDAGTSVSPIPTEKSMNNRDANQPPETPKPRNVALTALLGTSSPQNRITIPTSESPTKVFQSSKHDIAPSYTQIVTIPSKQLEDSDDSSNEDINPDTIDEDSTTDKIYRMDVDDFIEAAEIDDVLIQVLLMKPRKKILQMFSGESNSLNSLENLSFDVSDKIIREFSSALSNKS